MIIITKFIEAFPNTLAETPANGTTINTLGDIFTLLTRLGVSNVRPAGRLRPLE